MIYAREVCVVELRPGTFWVDVPPDADGALTVTRDPSRASVVDVGDTTMSPETLEAFPEARVIKIRVTVVEVPIDSLPS